MPKTKTKTKTAISTRPSVTLHNFFGANGIKTLAQKTKRNGAQYMPQKPLKLKDRESPIRQEIIVIDSDDEVEVVQVSRVKRRKTSVAHVDSALITNHDFSDLLPKKLLVEESSTNGSTGSKDAGLAHTISFGKPHLLTEEQPRTVQPDSSLDRLNALSFGACGPLLVGKPVSNNTSSSLLSPEITIISNTSRKYDSTDTDLPMDEWQTGDDELLTLKDEEDVDEFQKFVTLLNDQDISFKLEQHLDSENASYPYNFATDGSTNLLSNVNNKNGQNTSGPPAAVGNTNNRPNGDAFSVLMSSFKENEAWKEATIAEDKSFRPVKANGGRRNAPFYKVMQGMPIAVDAFRYGVIPEVTAYFLTHAHSDHYTNLSSNWKNGPIYCSQGTANLIIHMLNVDQKWVNPLPMDVPTLIPNTNGVHVTLIEANHCPGSCLFLFEGPQTVNAGDSNFSSPFIGSSRVFRYLHCGDFRASPKHILHPSVRGKRLDHVYLDTTYLDPKYTFPPQPLVISACAELARRIIIGECPSHKTLAMDTWVNKATDNGKHKAEERILVVVGTYSIGKERIVKAIAHALNSKIYCDSRKAAILRCQGDDELNELLTSDPFDAIVHVVPLGTITSDRLKIYMDRFKGKFTKVIGFRPTGWTYTQPAGTDQLPSITSILARDQQKNFTYTNLQMSQKSTSAMQLFPVPYSEHSSFYELTCFAMSCNWHKMIATVNVGSENSRGKMAKWVERWEAERRRRGKDEIVVPRNPDYW